MPEDEQNQTEVHSTATTTITGGTSSVVVCPDAHQKETILYGLITIAVIGIIMLGAIGCFSVYLQTLDPPREAGSSVGALRENVMAIVSGVMGALIMKAKGNAA